ncbi:MAG: histidine--tRNA ligase [Oscillospiraceae bacterium]|jgi:histidyl-tRNA synthetase|nr:histidine--tRNA ligase [Oscillospiraceae bacterium]
MAIQAPKGTYDVLPGRSGVWQAVERVMRESAALSGFREVRTPVFEHTELFQRGVGDTTDVVQKEMYTFTDKGGRSVTLKPEGTAGAVRAMLEAGMHGGPMPVKMYYINTPIFRYEAPQKGRMREHHQFGVEVFGAPLPTCDAEVIALALRVIGALGVKDWDLRINSIGCPECRAEYHKALRAFLEPRLDKLCGTCVQRFGKNPLRILDCKVEPCQAELVDAPAVLDSLCDGCREHFEGLKAALDALGIPYVVDARIVRGLDYYTRTVFEVVPSGGGPTITGGGRYDGLVEQLDGPRLAGFGFGMGMERLITLLEEKGGAPEAPRALDVCVAPLGEGDRLDALRLTEELRGAGIKADMDHVGRSLKAQFRYADKAGATLVVVVGGDEAGRGGVRLRDFAARDEAEVSRGEVVGEIRRRVGGLAFSE